MNTSLDLTNCDKERIHHISYTQGHGAFAAVSPLDLKIHHASENFPKFFDQTEDIHFFIGRKLTEVVSHDLSLMIQERIRSGVIRSGQHGNFVYQSRLDVFLYMINDDLYGVEFETLPEEEETYVSKEETVNTFIDDMNKTSSLEALATEACRAIRFLTGMERVMIYKFFPPTMYGEVIGEDKVAEAHSFMRHRFPATDIPKPARDLYLRNHVRLISDSHEKQLDIYPRSAVLDMSDSRLRGVSLIHIEYLKNMAVRGSFSVAIIVDQKLWGLIACHSSRPAFLSHKARTLCQTISHSLAMGASMLEKMEDMNLELNIFNKLHDLFDKLKKVHNPLDQLFREGNSVLELFKCHGMVLVSSDKIDFFGMTPLPDDIKKLWGWLINKMENEGKTTFVTESLAKERGEFSSMKDQVSGVIAMRLSEVSDRVLILMRSEYIETIHWGGDPRKNIDARNYGGMINPRISFDTWTEVLKYNSTPWSKHEIAGINYFKSLIFDSLVSKEDLLQELGKRLNS